MTDQTAVWFTPSNQSNCRTFNEIISRNLEKILSLQKCPVTYPQLRSEDPELAIETRSGLPALVLAALGVVYGDIGTSPLYAFREALHATAGSGSHRENVLGILSLIVWALTIVVTVKYVTFVLRADNRGEGGTLSLMTLARQSFAGKPAWILVLGVAGASLFLGDAIITPAISVLSAVEGIQVVAPGLSGWIVPITVTIIAVLFFVQRFGTGGVASVFGPIMAVWFLILGISGGIHILDDLEIFSAINPLHGILYASSNVGHAIAVLGAVFLAVTGAEALYVDLGHFGRRPIVTAWFFLVFPCLLLNYFGQGAFVLANPDMTKHPFFDMHPEWARVPIVCMAQPRPPSLRAKQSSRGHIPLFVRPCTSMCYRVSKSCTPRRHTPVRSSCRK